MLIWLCQQSTKTIPSNQKMMEIKTEDKHKNIEKPVFGMASLLNI